MNKHLIVAEIETLRRAFNASSSVAQADLTCSECSFFDPWAGCYRFSPRFSRSERSGYCWDPIPVSADHACKKFVRRKEVAS